MRIEAGYIELKGLCFHACHGLMAQERMTGGEFIVDVRVKADLTGAVRNDDVSCTLNYAEIYEIIKNEMLTPSNLLEHLAGRMGEAIFCRFPQIEELTLTVTKRNPPMGAQTEGASVTLHLINDKTLG
ncbi:MAG: dihydroneopterin aldolase [Prevotella sp.]|nr:dihydroneopterin aldolase [Prevotella sp.]